MAFVTGVTIVYLINSIKNKGKASQILKEAKKTAEQIKTEKNFTSQRKVFRIKI